MIDHWSTGCQIYGFLGGLTGTSAIMTIASMAGERFQVINNPFGRKLNSAKACIIVTMIWVYSSVFSSLPLFGVYSRYVPEGYLTSCSFDYVSDDPESKIFIFIYFLAAFCVPLTIIIFSYTGIIVAVRRSQLTFSSIPEAKSSSSGYKLSRSKATTPEPEIATVSKSQDRPTSRLSQMTTSSKASSNNNNRQQNMEIKLAKISAVLISLWVISWTPYAIVALIGIFSSNKSILTPSFSMVPALFAKAAAIIDPFVYGLSHPRFRSELKRMIFRTKRVPIRSERFVMTTRLRVSHSISVSDPDDQRQQQTDHQQDQEHNVNRRIFRFTQERTLRDTSF